MLQLDDQALPEGVVEHRIASRVGEVAQDDGVGLGQFRRARSGERPVSSSDDGGKRGGGASQQRALRSARRRRRDPRDRGGVLVGGALLALQIGADVRGGLIPKVSILLERLEHDLFEAFGQVGSNGPQRRRLLMENRGPNDGTVSRKRRTAGRHFVQHQPEREEVRSRVDLFAAQLLRRHVGQRADNAARVGQKRSGLELRRRRVSRRNARVGLDEAEVENLRSVRGQQDVGGLDIAVDDAGGMSRLKGVGEGGADVEE